jgi:hypothetical protein
LYAKAHGPSFDAEDRDRDVFGHNAFARFARKN